MILVKNPNTTSSSGIGSDTAFGGGGGMGGGHRYTLKFSVASD